MNKYLSQIFPVEMKLQPEPSAVLSQMVQRQQASILPHAPQVPTPPGRLQDSVTLQYLLQSGDARINWL